MGGNFKVELLIIEAVFKSYKRRILPNSFNDVWERDL